MPKIVLRQEFDMQTRNQYTKCKAEISISLDGTELPTMAITGKLLEQAITAIQNGVTESYQTVPARA